MSATHDDGSGGRSGPRGRRRRSLGVGEVAARLEHRLYLAEQTGATVREGCAFAVRHGLSSVIVRPEVVPAAGLALTGSQVDVVTVPGWRYGGDVEPLAAGALLAEARQLASEGATDLALLADVQRLGPDGGRRLCDQIALLVGAMRPYDVRVRVVLDTDGLSDDDTVAACELLGASGAWLVQGGSWRGSARTGLSRIQLMRAALPDDVRLKWTFPVRSVDTMLVCLAEGVDLFNCDPDTVLGEAARRSATGTLTVPVRGLDY